MMSQIHTSDAYLLFKTITADTWSSVCFANVPVDSTTVLIIENRIAQSIPEITQTALTSIEDTATNRLVISEKRDEKRLSFQLRRNILGKVLGLPANRIEIQTAPNGKPHLSPTVDNNLQFNYSHSNGFYAFAFRRDNNPVGIDLEFNSPTTDIINLAHRFFPADDIINIEQAFPINRPIEFLRHWTTKESCCKMHGDEIGNYLPIPSSLLEAANRTTHVTISNLNMTGMCTIAMPNTAIPKKSDTVLTLFS